MPRPPLSGVEESSAKGGTKDAEATTKVNAAEGTINANASYTKAIDSLAKHKYVKANEASSGRGSVVDEIIREVQRIDFTELQDSDADEKVLASYLKGKLRLNDQSFIPQPGGKRRTKNKHTSYVFV